MFGCVRNSPVPGLSSSRRQRFARIQIFVFRRCFFILFFLNSFKSSNNNNKTLTTKPYYLQRIKKYPNSETKTKHIHGQDGEQQKKSIYSKFSGTTATKRPKGICKILKNQPEQPEQHT